MTGGATGYFDLISGKRRGLMPEIARAGLTLLSLPFAAAMGLRNAYYSLVPGTSRKAPCPVISIGNITTGGTGKTPMAAAVANQLADQGRRVAIVLRGYGAGTIEYDDHSPTTQARAMRRASDEAMVLKRRCPRADIHINPDRVAAAEQAVRAGADVIVLDDGFQHRRLARDLDIVLVDATAPFGYGRLLPRGLLREPPAALRRADLVVITRTDLVADAPRAELARAVRQASADKPVLQAMHQIRGMMDLEGRPAAVDDAGAVAAVIFAGIANFEGFRRSVQSTGTRVLAAYQYPDHHDYTAAEIEGLLSAASTLEANALLTTEKDAVKLAGRWPVKGLRPLVLNLEIEFRDDGDKILARMLDAALARG